MPGERSAAQAGWRESRYSICAWPDGADEPIIANLYAGTMGVCTREEYHLLKNLDQVLETHPALDALSRRGLIVDFDERARLQKAWESLPRGQRQIKMTICPTMACNFDCPYCFQEHHGGMMTEEVQDQVALLADRLLETSGAHELVVVWYGGEPLLALNVIDRLSFKLNDACVKHGAGYRASVFTNGYLLDEKTTNLLFRRRVKSVRVTVDGLAATHDATRHLVGGGGTYERIIQNLSAPVPFPVGVRMNVHAGNAAEVEALREQISSIARATGNRMVFREAEVFDTDRARGRADAPALLSDEAVKDISLLRKNLGLHGATARRCFAQDPYSVCVDQMGRLYACSATLALPDLSFGDAGSWDPARPEDALANAFNRDFFLRQSLPSNDPECLDCLWLPTCVGGCPWLRMKGHKDCVPWKDDPEGFVVEQYARLGEKRADVRLTPAQVGDIAAPILRKYGVARAWVYGSVAQGTAHAESDVDMIVEMPEGSYLGYKIFDLRKELKEALGRKLDLHTPPTAHTNGSVARAIAKTKVLIYSEEE